MKDLSKGENVNKGGASLSFDRVYRHRLWRIWREQKPLVLWIMLNPSTADEFRDDATIRKCIAFSKSWGYGGMYVCNLFDFMARHISDMKKSEKPCSKENIKIIVQTAKVCSITICAWSNHGSYMNKDIQTKSSLEKAGIELHYMKINKTGQPAHPLYLKGSTKPSKWGFVNERLKQDNNTIRA